MLKMSEKDVMRPQGNKKGIFKNHSLKNLPKSDMALSILMPWEENILVLKRIFQFQKKGFPRRNEDDKFYMSHSCSFTAS